MALARAVNRYASGFDIYIGRSSKCSMHFGNPFTFKKGTQASVVFETRDEAINAFTEWLNGIRYSKIEPERRQWILDNIHTLVNKRLGCYCTPQACHGDVLAHRALLYQIGQSKFVTGVGSRNKVPKKVLHLMYQVNQKLQSNGYHVRTGTAKGCDNAFRRKVDDVPRKCTVFSIEHATEKSIEMAGSYHPSWAHCNEYARKLHGRNMMQVLGPKLQEPSRGVICWTPDGCEHHKDRTRETGGTGSAISVASMHSIPVHNLKNQKSFDTWTQWVQKG